MSELVPEENQQFEQVLSRLDALMKRAQGGHAAIPVEPPTLSAPVVVAETTAIPQSDTVVPEVHIPVLTDVYVAALPVVELTLDALPEASSELLSQNTVKLLISELTPLILQTVDLAVREELAKAQQAIDERLCDEVERLVRQRLAQLADK